MRDHSADFESGPDPTARGGRLPPPSGHQPMGPTDTPFVTPARYTGAPTVNGGPVWGGPAIALPVADLATDLGHDTTGLTNIYYLAQYTYQLSVSAVTMSDHELGLLLPRSGRVWFNAKIFTDMPHGRELAQRDAWWRAIDASPAVRFLLGWCVSIFRTAQFHQIPRDQLPGWSRVLYFSPALPECPRTRIQFWSDVAQDLTEVFAPASRVWRQIQLFAPIATGERRWEARLVLGGQHVDDVLNFLADRNSCPAALIHRALNGNPAIESYEEYRAFTERVIEGLPRLRMQRLVAMRQNADREPPPMVHPPTRIAALLRGQWAPSMADPRQEPTFWQLHL